MEFIAKIVNSSDIPAKREASQRHPPLQPHDGSRVIENLPQRAVERVLQHHLGPEGSGQRRRSGDRQRAQFHFKLGEAAGHHPKESPGQLRDVEGSCIVGELPDRGDSKEAAAVFNSSERENRAGTKMEGVHRYCLWQLSHQRRCPLRQEVLQGGC